MTVNNLLSRSIPPLRPDDSVEHALGLLMELRVRHLPVVDEEGLLVGVVSEEQLLDAFSPEVELSLLLGPEPVSARPHHHVFEITKLMVQHDLSTLPVAREDRTYVGLCRRHEIFDQFARMLSTQEAGAILALEVSPNDYSLSRLVYAIEQNDAKILSIATERPDSEHASIRVTLKLNVTETTRVRHMLEHHGYRIVASFNEHESDLELQERAQAFMRYLDM